MKPPQPLESSKARELREAFDAAFSRPLPPPDGAKTALLILGVGGEFLAVRRDELRGVLRTDAIAPAPGRSAAFDGLVAIRDEIYPLWNLVRLLGHSSSISTSEGWILLTGGGDSACAFRVETFEQMLAASAESLVEPDTDGDSSSLFQGAVQRNSLLTPILSMPVLLKRVLAAKEHSPSSNS